MPNYDYECKKCGVFEVFQPMTAEPLAKCPKCKGKVKRLIGGGAGIIFKGSGFYCTDYKKPTHSHSEKPAAAPECPKKKEGGCGGCPSGK
jgi:putative FmdB family regulatory protein